MVKDLPPDQGQIFGEEYGPKSSSCTQQVESLHYYSRFETEIINKDNIHNLIVSHFWEDSIREPIKIREVSEMFTTLRIRRIPMNLICLSNNGKSPAAKLSILAILESLEVL